MIEISIEANSASHARFAGARSAVHGAKQRTRVFRCEARIPDTQRGYLLVAVAMILAVIAVLGLIGNRESIIATKRVSGETEAQQAEYVARAGLEHAIWIAGQSACTGYTLPTTPFGAHSYQANFSPTTGSPVTISATGTLSGGFARTMTRPGTHIFQAPVTTVLPPAKDSYITIGNPDKNFGDQGDLFTDSETAGKGPERSLIQFDLSGIPVGVQLKSAELNLYLSANDGSQTDVVEGHRLARDWVEGDGGSGVNWNRYNGTSDWTTPGGDYAAEIAGSFVASGTGWKNMNISSLVQGWLDGNEPNHGVLLMSPPASGNNEKRYVSNDDSDQTLRPQLVLTYACDCGAAGIPGSIVLQPGAVGEDTYLRDGGNKANNFGAAGILKLNNSSAEEASLVKFDLSGMSVNTQIDSATIELWLEDGQALTDGVIDLHQVTQAWVEGDEDGATPAAGAGATYMLYDGQASWASPGGDYITPELDTVTIPALVPGWQQWNLTAAVQDWVSGLTANDGVLLRASGGNVQKIWFTSSDGAVTAQHPRLTINYTCPCGVDCTAGL